MQATRAASPRRVPRWAGAAVASAAVLGVVVALTGGGDSAAQAPVVAAGAASVPAGSSSAGEVQTSGAELTAAGSDDRSLRDLLAAADATAVGPLAAPRPVAENPGNGDGNGADVPGNGADSPGKGNGDDAPANGNAADNPGQGLGAPLFGDLPVERRGKGERGRPAPDVEARIVSTEMVTASGTGVGQVQREALMVTIEIVNSGGGRLALDTTTVTAFAADGTVPASPVDNDPRAEPFGKAVLPHRSVQGTFLFAVPPGGAEHMSVALMYDLDSPVTVFEGLLPTAG